MYVRTPIRNTAAHAPMDMASLRRSDLPSSFSSVASADVNAKGDVSVPDGVAEETEADIALADSDKRSSTVVDSGAGSTERLPNEADFGRWTKLR
jgi:hypothetical protein